MNQVINVGLLKNPLNWLIVWSMVILAAILGHFLLTWANISHTPDATQ